VTGHPVSHETALPDRLAPYTSAYPIPQRSISRPNAARRRRISRTENENPGFPHADTPQMLDQDPHRPQPQPRLAHPTKPAGDARHCDESNSQ
jgi:hypothetical protein